MKYIKEYHVFIDDDTFDLIYSDIKDIMSDINLELKEEHDDIQKKRINLGLRPFPSSPQLYININTLSLNLSINFSQKYNEDIVSMNCIGDVTKAENKIKRMIKFISAKYGISLSYGIFFGHQILISKPEIVDRIKFLYNFERKEEQEFFLYYETIDLELDSKYNMISEEIVSEYDIKFISMDGDVGLKGFRLVIHSKVDKISYVYDFQRGNYLENDNIEYLVDIYKSKFIYSSDVKAVSIKSKMLDSGANLIDSYKFTCNIHDDKCIEFYELFMDNFIKNSGMSKSKLLLDLLNKLLENTFFEIEEYDIENGEIVLYINDKIIKISVNNDLKIKVDGIKVEENDVIEEIYLKLTDKNAI
jgi:hypothetical protein